MQFRDTYPVGEITVLGPVSSAGAGGDEQVDLKPPIGVEDIILIMYGYTDETKVCHWSWYDIFGGVDPAVAKTLQGQSFTLPAYERSPLMALNVSVVQYGQIFLGTPKQTRNSYPQFFAAGLTAGKKVSMAALVIRRWGQD